VQAGTAINQGIGDIPRQLGLTARYGLEGLANTAQVVTEPIRYFTDKLLPDRAPTVSQLVTGQRPAPKSLPLGVAASNFADWLGLPKPQNANERVIGDATRLVAGSAGGASLASKAAAIPGIVGDIASGLAGNVPQQLTSAAGAGLLGGASREAGGNPLEQGIASVIGGVAGGLAPQAAESVMDAAKRLVSKPTDQQISVALQRAGVDWSQIPAAAQNSLRKDVANALNTGQELDPAALRRLADFRMTGLTPTRGMVSLDPVQITKEQNLAKIGANSSDASLQTLPMIQNRNNAKLISNLNEAGAAQGDQFLAGQSAIGAINSEDARLAGGVNQLYSNARNLAGGDLPLDRKPFIDNIFGALQRENRMAFLPKELGDTLNQISSGNTPFTPQTVDMLKTMFATASRNSTDGNVRAAISIARNALDNTPVNLPTLGPGVLTAAQASVVRNATGQANDVLDAMNRARAAAAQRFGWQESARPIEAALGGAQPDDFIKRFVIGGTLQDAQAVAQNAPVADVRNAILAHLKEKALNGAADEVGKFSQSAFNKTLNQIGDRKLSLFFTPDELAVLRANGRVASYMQVQPVGSAVNNSNSGALLLGKGYDALKAFLNKIPLGEAAITKPLTNIEIAIKNRQAQNVVPGLLAPVQKQPLAQGLLLPGVAVTGGLLAPPP
jgi:hypothetical protein